MGRFGSIRVLACCLAFSAALHAQQYTFRAFRQAEGLKNLSIDALVTDRLGFLWMATENGVFRFIGSGFEHYGLEQGFGETYVLDMVSDPDGAIWVATEANLYRWDGQRFLPAGSEPIRVQGQWHLAVEDAHHLLVIENGRLYRLEHDADGRMLSFLPAFSGSMLTAMPDLANMVSLSVVHDPHGGLRVWAGCGHGLCSWMAGAAGKSIQPGESGITEWGKEQGLVADRWSGVHLDRAGTLWAGGFAHVAVLPPGAARFADRSIPGPGLSGVYSHAPLVEDTEGRILVPVEEGIARWDGAGWRIIGRANGLDRANHIVGMAFDAAGDLWFASRGDGLYEWTGYANWDSWGDRQGLPSASIWSLALSQTDRVFFGTERGPAWIDPRSGSAHPLSEMRPWSFNQVQGLVDERDGSLLGMTLSGIVFRLDTRTGRTKELTKIPASIVYTLKDSSRNLFFQTSQGLYLSRLSTHAYGSALPKRGDDALFPAAHRIPAADALAGASMYSATACESPGGPDWFGVGDHLLRLKGSQWSAPPIDGMPKKNGDIYAISCARDGSLWMVTAPGITWRLISNGDRLQASQITPPLELSTLVPVAILIDRRGWLWLGTDQGLVVWNGQSWRHLTQESGLIWNDVDENVMTEAADGSLWIGTSGGVSRMRHPERVFDPIQLSVAITKIRRGETNYLGAKQITLPWGGSPLRFQISSPNMRNRSELALKIRMVGYQSEWMDTHDGDVTFARLPPGKFTLMVMACNSGLNACSEPVRVDIRILPPWWRSIWFYALCGLKFIGILVGGVHLYARRLRSRSRELERLVSERTRELEISREQLRVQATHDGLTGLLNRAAILRILVEEMERARRESQTVVVALIDLDHFKRINDSHGHLVGDEALRWFTSAVGSAIRAYDHAGRYGGEEFLLVLTQIPREAVEQRLAVLHGAITNLQVSTPGAEFQLNCSVGATVFDPSRGLASVESLLAAADQNLYAAKAAGRNRVVFRPVFRSGSQTGSHEVLSTLR
jgi:diguanylate cyclase (GGDEF)-like protein